MSPKRGAYPAEVRRAALEMLREGRDVREVAEELDVTRTTIGVWLQQAGGLSHRPDRSRESVIGLTKGAYERLDGLLRKVPVASLETLMPSAHEAIDPWRVKDAIAHVAHYKASVAQRLVPSDDADRGAAHRRLAEYWDPDAWADLEASDQLLETLDAKTRRRHRVNHLVYLRWHDRAGSEILAWHRSVHRHVISVLESGPDDWFLPDDRRAARGSLSHESVAALSAHSDTHLRDISAALGVTAGRPRRRSEPRSGTR